MEVIYKEYLTSAYKLHFSCFSLELWTFWWNRFYVERLCQCGAL